MMTGIALFFTAWFLFAFAVALVVGDFIHVAGSVREEPLPQKDLHVVKAPLAHRI